jgi:DinB superfamily
MQETPQQYTQRILSYVESADPLRVQQATAKKLASLMKGKNKKQLTRRPAPEKWSVAEVMAHLADVEIAVGWRLRLVLTANAVSIQAYDQDAWAATFGYARRDPWQSLELFRTNRDANIRLVKSVPRELWNNYGVHQERGNESVSRIVRMVAGHDLNHLKQIEGIVKSGKKV